MNKKLNAENLKNELWDTLLKVKSGTIDHETANAISSQAREILRTIKMQLQVASMDKKRLPLEAQKS